MGARQRRIEEIILTVLEEGENYGYPISRRVHAAGRDLLCQGDSELYSIIRGLENEGHLEAYVRQVDDRNRYYYRLTDAGHKRLQKLREAQKEKSTPPNILWQPRGEGT